MKVSLSTLPRYRIWPLAIGGVSIVVCGLLLYGAFIHPWDKGAIPGKGESGAAAAAKIVAASAPAIEVVTLTRDQQKAIGLTVVTAAMGLATDVVEAPGQIVPDETRFAYITPRAAGIVRTVAARVGQNVEAGTLLALIDSPEVAKARFELYTCMQELEIAQTQEKWQETTYKNTQELVELLRKSEEPEVIHDRFQNRPLGENREQLLTAYANLRLQKLTKNRNDELIKQKVITPKQFQQVRADYETAQATYQGLMDQMGFNNKLAYARAQQNLKRAETALRVARAQLRVLGVPPDGTEPEIKDGKVIGVRSDGTLPVESGKPSESARTEPVLSSSDTAAGMAVAPVGATSDTDLKPENLPVSTYAIWAPFDGTVLDRELVVPGVSVDTTHRIFTLADLSTIWIEVAIHESRFGALSRSQDALVLISSPAYPGRTFEANVIYTGDLVDLKSRNIKLLARASNPDRLLKPGMFVEVAIRLKGTHQAPLIPEAAILTEADHAIVFVQTGPEQFEQRRVVAGASDGEKVAVLKGIEPGETVVVEGGFKLKAIALTAKQ